MQKLMPH